jgi:site-specific recombinase XerD
MKSPLPLIDNLTHLNNPYRHPAVITDEQSSRFAADLKADEINLELTLALQFLYSYRGSPDTFATYRREIERLLQWAWFVEGLTLKQIRREHFEQFIGFCQQPPISWIGTKNVARFIDDSVSERVVNTAWRPFVSKTNKRSFREGHRATAQEFELSGSAIQSIFSVCSSFFNFLIQEEYSDANPVAQIRQKSKYIKKHQGAKPIRRLSSEQWQAILAEVEQMADQHDDVDKYERMLFVMTALYGLYLRISELVTTDRWQPSMSDFWKDSEGQWWFTTVGKGNKERDVSVSDSILKALVRYRRHLGLTDLPLPSDHVPLLPKTRGKGGIASTRQVRNIVQEAFDLAIARLENASLKNEAEELKLATVHWLRHTGISDDVKHRPREHVRDDAGHGSSAITDRYIDVERRARHQSARHKQLRPEENID